MKPIGIVTDSHSGISQEEAGNLGILVVPMPFYMGEECYLEGVSMSREEFFRQLGQGAEVHTSQPSPEDVMGTWRKGLEEYEKLLYIPISSGLSGSCNTARALAQEPEFEDKVLVVDNGRVSALLHRSILDGLELIGEGRSAQDIKDILEASNDDMVIYIAVETLEHLKRGGRITAATAAFGTILNIKPILRLGIGVLETYRKCRGMKKARREMLELVRSDLENRFRDAHEKQEVYLLAAASADDETSRQWVEEIKAYFPGMDVLYDPLTIGISCHIGPGGLGIALSCRPKR